MPSTVDVNLPDDLLDSMDQEVAAGRYPTREEFVRRAVRHMLALDPTASTDDSHVREPVEPAEDWAGDAGLCLLGQASRRLPYSDDAAD
ncbi:MAG: ribbon-helix-helix domain-containing protein [Thermoleophilaceae bacterium]